jgi:hypothetical protein
MMAKLMYDLSLILERAKPKKKGKDWSQAQVTHPGILEVPAGKSITDLKLKHFLKLVQKKGYNAIRLALQNLERWNKNRDPKLSKWARKMLNDLRKSVKE